MAKLLLTILSSTQSTDDEQDKKQVPGSHKHHTIATMLWHLPGSDISVSTTPTLDLLGYQNLIIQGYFNYQDGRWVIYDC